MSGRRAGAAGLAVWLTLNLACGKRGDPQAPLRPIPARVTDLAAHRVDDRVELTLTIPPANLDGSAPAAVDRIEIFGVATAEGAPPPAVNDVLSNPKNVRIQLAIQREDVEDRAPSTPAARGTPPPQGGGGAPPAATRPVAGDAARLVDRLDRAALTGAATLHYVARGVTGSGRGRPGPGSTIVSVPIGTSPAAPREVRITYDDSGLTVTWQPAETGQVFRVFAVDAAAGGTLPVTTPRLLTPAPLQTPELKSPVEFGREACFLVRAVTVAGPVTVDGAPAGPVCATPVDTFPPPAPRGLQAVQEGAAITLLWTGSEAADLAGYRVLRGEGTDAILRQLTTEPITGATYADTTTKAGVTYTYSVVAVDKSGNLSGQSNRESVTVR